MVNGQFITKKTSHQRSSKKNLMLLKNVTLSVNIAKSLILKMYAEIKSDYSLAKLVI